MLAPLSMYLLISPLAIVPTMEDMLGFSDSCLDAKGRTLVSVRYTLEGFIEGKHIELTQITQVQIPQHACSVDRKDTHILTAVRL
jgi:hypothetical protein